MMRWFRNKPKFSGPASATDLHSHLLPGIDDGVQSLEEALEVIKGFANLGYRRLITTPHIMHDYYRNTPGIIRSKLAEVQQAAARAGTGVTLEAAAEYYLDEYFLGLIEAGEPLLAFGRDMVLFELPFINKPPLLQEVVFALQTRGYRPVLAHPERYPYFARDFAALQNLQQNGVLLQLNLLSLAGYYGREVKKQAEKLLRHKLISLAGSDCHNARHLIALGRFWQSKAAGALYGYTLLNDSL